MPGTLRAKRSALPTRLRTHDCSLRPLDARGVSPSGSSQASPPPPQGPPPRGHGPLSTSASPSSRCRAMGSPGRTVGEGGPSPCGSAGSCSQPSVWPGSRERSWRPPGSGWTGQGWHSGLQTWVAPRGPLETQSRADVWGSGETLAEDWRLGAGPRLRWEGSCGEACGGRGWRCRCPSSPFRHIMPLLGLRAPLGEGVKECWATWQAGKQPLGPGFCHATMPPGEGASQSPSGCSVPAHPGPAFRNPLAGSDADGACQGGGGKRGP